MSANDPLPRHGEHAAPVGSQCPCCTKWLTLSTSFSCPPNIASIDQVAWSKTLRDSAARVRDAFSNYLDGAGLDARMIALALPVILDELERLRLTPKEVDEPTLEKISNDFDSYAKKRAAELLRSDSLRDDHLQKISESSFCLGYIGLA